MALSAAVLIFLSLITVASSSPRTPTKPPALPIAISSMQSNSYYGFVILLNMLNATTKSTLSQEVTFFMPSDQQLAVSPVSQDQLEEFVLGHTIPEPLVFSELSHIPTGTLIPSFVNNRLLRISSAGRHVFVNNAQIVAPNVCSSGAIKCHGINAVITGKKNQAMDSASTVSSQGKNNEQSN